MIIHIHVWKQIFCCWYFFTNHLHKFRWDESKVKWISWNLIDRPIFGPYEFGLDMFTHSQVSLYIRRSLNSSSTTKNHEAQTPL